MKKIYIASPLGFSEVGNHFMHNKIFPILTKENLIILDPWEMAPNDKIKKILSMPRTSERKDKFAKINKEIGKINANAIKDSDFLFAVLDGTDIDSGTASEIGYACALGKPIIGYRGDFRLSADNEGSKVNLQVEYFIYKTGGKIIHKISELKNAVKELITKV